MLRPVLLAALAATAFAAPIRAADDLPPTTAMALLKNVAAAKMGPVTISSEVQLTVEDRRRGMPTETVEIRNDPAHRFGHSDTRMWETDDLSLDFYRNGKDAIVYNTKAKLWNRPPDDLLYDLVQDAVDSVARGLSHPDVAGEWARLNVETVRIDGNAFYEITIKKSLLRPDKMPGAHNLVLTVDPRTFLVRKCVVSLPESIAITEIMNYRFMPKPFPAEAFIFTPPPGAKEDKGEDDKDKTKKR